MGIEAITIGHRKIGPREPVFIVAEAGVNHNGKVELAKRLVDAAVQAGADAVKFQTFRAEEVMISQAPKADYQLQTTDSEESQLEMAKGFELPFEAFDDLHQYSRQRGILFMSTPFDYPSVDYLDSLGVAVFKIASGEITNLPFLQHIAGMDRPIILYGNVLFR